MEGMDCDYFNLEEIRKGILFSKKKKNYFQVVPVPILEILIKKLFTRIGVHDE